jgi:hypothetical protein
MRRLSLFLCAAAVAALTLAPAASAAAPGINALYVAQKSGRQITFNWEGSIIHYKARTLGWVDALLPWSPQTSVNDIEVDLGRAYVAAGLRGLRIVDVGDPANAAEVGAWEPTDVAFSAQRVSVQGAYAYVADLHVVQVLDVSNPASPVPLSQMWIDGNATGVDDVEVVGNCAYIVGYETADSYPFELSYYLLVFDISNPAGPVWTGSCGLPDTAGQVRLTVQGSYAYVGGDYMCVVDVSNPASPQYVSWAWAGPSKAASLCAGPAVDSRYAFVASNDRMAVFNITASTPRYVGSLVASWPYSTGVGVALTEPGAAKRYALVAYDKAGDLNGFIEIIDASRPLRLDHDHGEWTGGGGSIECVTVSGDWAYEGRSGETTENFVITHLGPTAYSWVFDRRARTVPDRRADGPQNGLVASVTVAARGRGLWYFHVRGCDRSGHWGPTRTIRIRVR